MTIFVIWQLIKPSPITLWTIYEEMEQWHFLERCPSVAQYCKHIFQLWREIQDFTFTNFITDAHHAASPANISFSSSSFSPDWYSIWDRNFRKHMTNKRCKGTSYVPALFGTPYLRGGEMASRQDKTSLPRCRRKTPIWCVGAAPHTALPALLP